MKTLLKRTLRTVLFLAVLSICSLNVWAEGEVKPGLLKIRYVDYVGNSKYLIESERYGQKCFAISSDTTSENSTFLVDLIGEGRLLLAVGFEKKEGYTKGRYLYSCASPDLGVDLDPAPSKEALENSYFECDYRLETFLLSVEAIRIGNFLYIVKDQQIDDISKLEDMVKAGSIKKIDLTKAGNFIFLLTDTEGGKGNISESVVITSEIGGSVGIHNDFYAGIRGNTYPVTPSTFIVMQMQIDNLDQVEVNGLNKFKYTNNFSGDRYLSEISPSTGINKPGDIGIGTSGENVFHVDTIGRGRHIMALDYEEMEGYSKGKFMFNSCVFPVKFFGNKFSPLPDEVVENCFFEGVGGDRIYSIEAIRIGDALYTTPEMPATMSVLNEMVQSGSVKKIDLTKKNNFVFLYNYIEYDPYDTLPDDAIEISSEIGGWIVSEDFSGQAVIIMERDIHITLFFVEPVESDIPDNNEKFAAETAKAYIANGELIIQSSVAETISVYSATGVLYLQKQKNSGAVTYDISNLPQGVFIINGSSGWAKKVIK